jgi:SAM-dependent methyltransferase
VIAFTICARNYLAQAQVLHDGLRRHHPDLSFHVALCDDLGELEPETFPFRLLSLDEVGIPDIAGMIDRYNITELNTSIKAFVFLRLFDDFPGRPVIYLDPDIAILSPLTELEHLLRDGANCVLSPHLCEPAEYAEMHDGRMLQFGVYNLGFCALRDTPEVRRVVAWWGRRLERQCIIDLPSGLFVDQKWADLFPAFIDRTVILRHPGYNVGYWNLSQRTVRRNNGSWQVNGQPLRFFHFSGCVVDEPVVFSRHCTEFRLQTLRDVAILLDEYITQVDRFGRRHYRSIPYAFLWHGESGQNLHTPGNEQRLTSVQPRRAGSLGDLEPPPHLPLIRARSLGEYRNATAGIESAIRRRRALEASLLPTDDRPFTLEAHCVICGTQRILNCSFMYSTRMLPDGRRIPNWREHLDCRSCGFTNRLRASLHILLQEIRPTEEARIFVTEQVTPLYKWLARRYTQLVGSEYLGPERAPGEQIDGLRHEDVQRLSFQDAAFDLIVSFEVLEHVPVEQVALSELARCLKSGGTLFLTAPFRDDLEDNEVRAVLRDDGTIEHVLPPEIHGNPLDPDGALCFRYFGWRLLDELRAANFADVEVWFYWSRRYGYLGDTNSIIVARR